MKSSRYENRTIVSTTIRLSDTFRQCRRERNASHLDDLVGRRMSANNTGGISVPLSLPMKSLECKATVNSRRFQTDRCNRRFYDTAKYLLAYLAALFRRARTKSPFDRPSKPKGESTRNGVASAIFASARTMIRSSRHY